MIESSSTGPYEGTQETTPLRGAQALMETFFTDTFGFSTVPYGISLEVYDGIISHTRLWASRTYSVVWKSQTFK